MKTKTPLGIFLTASIAMIGCTNNDQTAGTSTDAGEVTTLRFSHFMTATDNINTEALEPWAKKIEADSKGRLKVEIYPSATLSKPGATYDATAKGIVDIGMQAQGYTAGRFPLTQVAELAGYYTIPHSSRAVYFISFMMKASLKTSMQTLTCSL